MIFCYYTVKLFVIYLLLPIYVSSQILFVPATVKGVRGGTTTLTCIPPHSLIAHPTILWEKTTGSGSVNAATSVSGIPHISDHALKERASLNNGNLTISSLAIEDSGKYTCTVTAIQSPPQSASVELIVTAAPKISASVNPSPSITDAGFYRAAACVAEYGKPKPVVRWTNEANKDQHVKTSSMQNKDGSWSMRSELLLRPGLLRRKANSTRLIATEEKTQVFFCHVDHENLMNSEERIREVAIDLLYAPVTYISLLGNQLTCHAEGNPQPDVTWFLPDGRRVSGTMSLYLGQTSTDNGLYTCFASNALNPDSVASLNVEKARDLPVLFRTLVRLNTSLPTTASGYEITCLADVDKPSTTQQFGFEWTKNGKKILPGSYQITSQIDQLSKTSKTRMISSLRFIDVVKRRDDAVFECRLVNRSLSDNFVTAVERSVRVSVDYAPTEAEISVSSSDFTAVEGKALTLNCTADSQPPSTIEWYFKGKKIGSGPRFTIEEIARGESGVYRCLAYNYVPGSTYADVKITVLYPPSQVVIQKLPENVLSCGVKGGSLPPPIYSWLFPNRTVLRNNMSSIKLSSSPSSQTLVYTCLVTNNLGITANATYKQYPMPTAKIGLLSVTEFTVTIVVCSFVLLSLLGIAGWFMYRKVISKSENMSADEAFKRYLQYAESPKKNGFLSSNPEQSSPYRTAEFRATPNHNTSSDCDDKQPAIERLNDQNKSYCASENPALNCTTIAPHPPSSCIRSIRELTSPQSHSTKQYPSYTEVEGGSSVEITTVESLRSSATQKSSEASVDRAKKPAQDLNVQSCEATEHDEVEVEKKLDFDRSATLPSASRIASYKNDISRRMQAQGFLPLQYISQGTLTGGYISRVPIQVQRQSRFDGAIQGCDRLLYNATWRTAANHGTVNPNFRAFDRDLLRLNYVPDLYTQVEETSGLPENCEMYLESGKGETGPRSVSLSASSTACKPTKSADTKKDLQQFQELQHEDENKRSLRMLSPLAIPNLDQFYSANAIARKHQSLTLV